MKRALIAGLIFVSGYAVGADIGWEKLPAATSDGRSLFFDRATIQRGQRFAKIWTKASSQSKCVLDEKGFGSSSDCLSELVAVAEVRQQYLFDCKLNTYATIAVQNYSMDGALIRGKVLRPEEYQVMSTVPNSIQDLFQQLACNVNSKEPKRRNGSIKRET